MQNTSFVLRKSSAFVESQLGPLKNLTFLFADIAVTRSVQGTRKESRTRATKLTQVTFLHCCKIGRIACCVISLFWGIFCHPFYLQGKNTGPKFYKPTKSTPMSSSFPATVLTGRHCTTCSVSLRTSPAEAVGGVQTPEGQVQPVLELWSRWPPRIRNPISSRTCTLDFASGYLAAEERGASAWAGPHPQEGGLLDLPAGPGPAACPAVRVKQTYCSNCWHRFLQITRTATSYILCLRTTVSSVPYNTELVTPRLVPPSRWLATPRRLVTVKQRGVTACRCPLPGTTALGASSPAPTTTRAPSTRLAAPRTTGTCCRCGETGATLTWRSPSAVRWRRSIRPCPCSRSRRRTAGPACAPPGPLAAGKHTVSSRKHIILYIHVCQKEMCLVCANRFKSTWWGTCLLFAFSKKRKWRPRLIADGARTHPECVLCPGSGVCFFYSFRTTMVVCR